MIDYDAYVAHLRSDGRALMDAARGNLDEEVTSCPGWSVRDLVEHTGVVHRHKTHVLRTPGTQRPDVEIATPGNDQELFRWYQEGLAELVGELSSVDPELEVWTWDGTNRAWWWARRMAQETAVHRWDAEAATGDPEDIDPELAMDGIDEYLFTHLPPASVLEPGEGYEGVTGEVSLRVTDEEDEWAVILEAPAPYAIEGMAEAPQLSVSGEASDMLLFLWRRVPPERMDIRGDQAVLDDLWTWLGFVGE